MDTSFPITSHQDGDVSLTSPPHWLVCYNTLCKMLLAFASLHTFAVGYHKARYRTRHSTKWSLALEPRFRCLVGLRPVRNLLQESSLFDSWYLGTLGSCSHRKTTSATRRNGRLITRRRTLTTSSGGLYQGHMNTSNKNSRQCRPDSSFWSPTSCVPPVP